MTIQEYKYTFSIITGSHINHKIVIETFFISLIYFQIAKKVLSLEDTASK
jgi:hypothetical protein